MKCPECKIVVMDRIDMLVDYPIDEPYYKCPKCGIELTREEIEER